MYANLFVKSWFFFSSSFSDFEFDESTLEFDENVENKFPKDMDTPKKNGFV